jgi:hypothetical protein
MNISPANNQFETMKPAPRQRFLPAALALFLAAAGLYGRAAAQSVLSRVIVPAAQTVPEQALTTMLVEEAHVRAPDQPAATVEHVRLLDIRSGTQVVVIAQRDALTELIPVPLMKRWRAAVAGLHPTDKAEGFSVVGLPWSHGEAVIVAGNDARGELFGAGWLLRQMKCRPSPGSFACSPRIPSHLKIFTAPDKPARGHQIGYRNKNNTYDAWDLAQFEQQIRDLAIFGGNALQIIAPVSDDDSTSVLYPAPPLRTVLGISGLLQKYGLDCDLYYPEMRSDYSKPEQVEAELKDFEALVKAMPRLDALYVPGGDPGHTLPTALFPLVQKEAEVLHRYHPEATVWVSAQGFDRARYQTFYSLLNAHPGWLSGVFFGPQSRDSFETQRRKIPGRYAMQFYPDIAHTMHSQFPVPRWDPVWGLTEGREPICPRPAAFAEIYRHYRRLHSGFMTYSEGVNDDVNKVVFTQLGWSASTPVDTILSEYARWFLRREGMQNRLTVQAIDGLETDWTGPIEASSSIAATRTLLERLNADSTPEQVIGNGRWESLLYRETYDDYVQRKLARERKAESRALDALSQKQLSETRVKSARQMLSATAPDAVEQQEHAQLFLLADKLFHDWGLQLSVPLYHAENWERGANLDRVDTPLNDAAWLRYAMDMALRHPTETEQQAALDALVHWDRPVAGSLYDDLGDPTHEPHLVRGTPWADDPEMYNAAIDGIADRTLALNPSPTNITTPSETMPWRLSWIDYAETLYEVPLTLHYRGLDPRLHYHVRVTYAGEDYALPLRLTANDVEVHPARLRHGNPETVEFDLPAVLTQARSLTLRWTGPAGSGGSGRGRQVAEVWLLPQPNLSQPSHRFRISNEN